LLSAKPTEYSEAVRRLRSTLIPKQAMLTGMVILTTSDFVTAGKSLLTLGLARSYALLGKKVLVIGADMRDMALARQLGQTASAVTLQTVLADRTALQDASIRHAELEIDLLLPAPQSGSPADMFKGADFEALMALVRAEYDVVLVDAPPLLTAPDAALIAPLADRLVFVAGASASTAESVISAVEQLPSGLGQGNVVALYAAEDTSELRMRVQSRKFAKL
jgi:receptor protein-tyrosine kinase